MKRLLTFLAAVAVFFSACTQFDDSELLGRLDQMEGQVQKLEELCRQMNTNISSLQSLVSALENQDYITDVSPLMKDGVEIGYKIKFVKSPSIIIYHGQKGADAEVGHVPSIGVRQDEDGVYYWTLDGEWLLGRDGRKVRAVGETPEINDEGAEDSPDAIIPELKIENGEWYVSYDEGLTWDKVGVADGANLFEEIKDSVDDVVFVLTDGTEITVQKALPLSITFAESDLLVMGMNSARDIRYSVNGNVDDVVVDVIASGNVKAKAVMESMIQGVIQIKTGNVIDEYCKVVVFVSDAARTIVRTLLFEEANIEVLDTAIKEIGDDGGDLTLEYASNVDCEVVIPQDAVSWLSVVSTKAMEEHAVVLRVAPNPGAARSAEVVLKSEDGVEIAYMVKQRATFLEAQRDILIEFYKATNGRNWTVNHRWCSDRPLSEWYGVGCDEKGYVTGLNLPNNNLLGDIPECLSELHKLEVIDFGENSLTGNIPVSFFTLTNLKSLNFELNPLTGDFPVEIGNLENLERLTIGNTDISGSLPASISKLKKIKRVYIAGNKLSGVIPPELATLMDASYFRMEGNYFTGKIPEEVINHPNWKHYWTTILDQNTDIDTSGIKLPAPEFSIEDIYGNHIDSKEVYAKNEYTVLYTLIAAFDSESECANNLKERYEYYRSKGVDVISFSDSYRVESVRKLFEQQDIPWRHIGVNLYPSMPWVPFYVVVDKNENIVYYGPGESNFYDAFDKIVGVPEMYESTDYSRHGKVSQLLKASKGNGIDMVFMGDAYSDRLIADGTYDNAVKKALENFFTEEPYKTYRDHFNVYQVDLVSKNEVIASYSNTVLGTYFGGGTIVGGNDQQAFYYARKALPDERMDDALVVVLMNKDAYAGTCYMYYPNDGDYGRGQSVSYFPTNSDEDVFRQLMLHEAAGHGFAKLGDEYSNVGTKRIPDNVVWDHKDKFAYGWWKNVDFTSDLTEIKWSKFINDSRYTDEELGAFEGGLTYELGVWRPTENSIMRNNTGGFNAPSREAIYYRINKLAYGDAWEYDYEEFVEYDAINRNKSTKSGKPNYVELPKNLEPLAPPVVYNYSWREAK